MHQETRSQMGLACHGPHVVHPARASSGLRCLKHPMRICISSHGLTPSMPFLHSPPVHILHMRPALPWGVSLSKTMLKA